MLKTFTFNPLAENTYVLSNEDGEAVVIDCGALYPNEQEEMVAYFTAHKLTPVAHLLTHAHFDHVFGADFLYQNYGLKPCVHASDLPLLSNIQEQMRALIGHSLRVASPPVGDMLEEGKPVVKGGFSFDVILCPGHTPGGVCLYVASQKLVFSGDSLFRESIGRTDFPGGNHWQLIKSLHTIIKKLPGDTMVYPGHGPATSIAHECEFNSFLN